MRLSFGLIAVIAAQAAFSPSKLNCVENLFKPKRLTDGILVYRGEGGDKIEILEQFVKEGNVPWTFIADELNVKWAFRSPGTYVTMVGVEHFGPTLDIMAHLPHYVINWNPRIRTVFVIHVHTKIDNYPEIASSVISAVWSTRTFEVVVLFELAWDKEDVLVFSANPFDQANSCGKEVRAIAALQFCGGSRDVIDPSMWPVPKKFSNCTLKVSRREAPPFAYKTPERWSGVDSRFVNQFSKRFGLTVTWRERPSPESGHPESVVHQYYTHLANGKLDMAIGGVVIQNDWYFRVDYLRPHSQQYLKYYVPRPTPFKNLEIVLKMFPINVWYLVIAALFFGGLGLSVLWEGTLNIRQTRFLMLIAILYAQTIKQPKRWSLRLYLALFLFGLLQISLLHSTSIQSYTLSPPRHKGIHSFDQILRAKMPIYVSETDFNLIDVPNSTTEHLSIVQNPIHDYLNLLYYNRNVSVLTRSFTARVCDTKVIVQTNT